MLIKPWYKQFWPWALIALPVLTMFKAAHTIYIMNQQKPDLVVDDYYAEGKAINMNLAKYREAALRNLQANILLAADKAVVRFASKPELGDTLELQFVHNTVAAKDFVVKAERSGENLYITQLPTTLSGKWNLVVTDNSQQWKLRAELTLPHQGEIKLTY
ncbi:FixH family protein [Rheinheimera sp.]|uniref:FixH family protein n=1 Tax=Rheinheimera sp. TaxID=1869214 RepID=UPI0027BA1763|nr:FixH family protein [Rheinheimera sp.]